MKRYLLFDSGCCQCSKIAESIEQEAGGKLTIRSLRDPAVKELLDRERPGWKWEPMLVEEKSDKVRIYAGRALARRLLMVLGPRRAWGIVRLMSETRPPQNISDGRREFMKKAGISALSLLFLPSFRGHDGIFKTGFKDRSSQAPLTPDKESIAINVTRQSSTFRHERSKLQYSVVMPHPENDNVVIVVSSDTDIYSDAMPSHVLITFVDIETQKALLSAPVSISDSSQDKHIISISDEHREGTFILTKQGALVSEKITPLKGKNSEINRITPSRIGDPIETGCNPSCICSLVCGSIPIWYCWLVGEVGTPAAVVVCGIIWLVLCSWICQGEVEPDQLLGLQVSP